MQEKLPKRSRSPVHIKPTARRAIKRATSRYLRRAARRNPETVLGLSTRSRTKGWAD